MYHISSFITFARKYTFINNLHLVSENTVLKYGIFPFYFTDESKTAILFLFTVIKIKKMKSMFMQMVIEHMHNRRYAKRSIELYSKWIISFIRFNNNRHPSEMGDKEVEVFLSHLVNAKNVAQATQASALNALAFLHRDILERPLLDYLSILKAKECDDIILMNRVYKKQYETRQKLVTLKRKLRLIRCATLLQCICCNRALILERCKHS